MRAALKKLASAWVASWLFLLWTAICLTVGAFFGMSAAGTAIIAMLKSRGAL